ncbi:S8 family serine peptidase [Pseudonocardia sp. GCM10023141]
MLGAVGLTAAMLAASTSPALAASPPRGPATPVFVELDRPSALQQFSGLRAKGPAIAQAAARSARTAITGATDELLARFRGAESVGELFRTSNAVPGVAVLATPAMARKLAAQPGVRSVRRITPATLSNAGADQLGRAMQAWQQTGRLGTGVRVGVVDTGIDYTHADFGGPGTKAAYQAVDPAHAAQAAFPTAKVIGGVDLAGDAYDADSPDQSRNVPNPDDNPLDCEGHGSHVAGTAAGLGVTADGATFRGDPRTLTPATLNAMKIGPGAAPGALLYAIKIFGCTGSTALTAQGLDRALDPNGDGDFDDRLDVVNLSLGSSFSAVDDPVNDFVRVLTENGVLVVAAAGNGGDLYDAGGSPGNSPDAIAVASVRDAGVLLDGAEVRAPAAAVGPLVGQYSVDYTGYDSLDLTAPVVQLGGPNAEGCQAYSPTDADRVRGRIVWLAWSDVDAERACGSKARADNAATAGAVGVLLPSAQRDFGSTRIAGDEKVPVFQLTATATAAVAPALAGGQLQVRLAGALAKSQQIQIPAIEDTPSTFSSRGVRGPTVKPDVAAPGESITSVAAGTGSGRVSESGTSMASPFVAGVAALVLEEHPDWPPARVKAAIMGTATADVYSGEKHTGAVLGPMRVGSGRIDARAALATTLLAANADDPGGVSVTFGTLEVPMGAPLERHQRIRITNTGTAAASLGVAYRPATSTPGVQISVSPANVVVAPGQDALVDVALRIADPSALRRTADPTLELVQEGRAREYLADASGRVVLTPSGQRAAALRVPVSVSPKPVSALKATLSGGLLTLAGTGVEQGSGREAYRSRAGVFALAATSPQLPICESRSEVAGCVANATGRGGDLRDIGVTSTIAAARAAGAPGGALFAVAVTTWADLYNVGSTTQPAVEFDTDGDGKPDFLTELVSLPDTDDLVARTTDLRAMPTPKEVDIEPVNGFDGSVDTNVFDTNAWVLPVRIAALGIDPAAASAPLRLRVVVHGEYGPPGVDDGMVDATGFVAADPLAPTVAAAPQLGAADPDVVLMPASGGASLAVTSAARSSVLVVLGQNGSGSRTVVLGPGHPEGAEVLGTAPPVGPLTSPDAARPPVVIGPTPAPVAVVSQPR